MMRNLLLTFMMVFAVHFAFAQSTITHVAPAFNGSTSALRSPSGTSATAYLRGASIIPASELTSGIPSGTSIKKFGFVYNAGATTAVTGTLKIYMMNTTDASFLHSTVWDSVVAHSVLVYNGSYTVPATAGVSFQDIVLSTPFTYNGGGMYVAYDWYSAGPYATTGAISQSSTVVTGGVKMSSSASAAPTNLSTSSNWRPVMRFGYDNPFTTDASLIQVYTYGKMPVPAGNPHAVKAIIRNQGSDTLIDLKAYLNITGSNTFADSLTIDSLLPGADEMVTFSNFMATNMGSNSVTVSVPSDQNTVNNSMSKTLETNLNSFNFSQGTVASGSAGFNSATGDFVAKFTTSTLQALNQVDVNFASSGNQFKIGVWSVGNDGAPDTLTYTSSTFTSAAGVYTVVLNPPVMIPAGSFFVGVMQIGTTNIGFQYQTENPIRPSTFFYASPTGDTNWTDFAPTTAFRFMIEPKFALSTDVGVNLITPNSSATIFSGQSVNVKAVVANYGSSSQSNIPVKYMVNGVLNPTTLTVAGPLAMNDTASVTFSGANAFIPSSAGTYHIKVFTALTGDLAALNDTSSVTYTVLPSAITSFPYIQNFDSAQSWTITGTPDLWLYDSAFAAVGNQSSPNPAVYANFYDITAGGEATLKSPVLNISGLSNPVLRFHVAYRSYSSSDNDSLQVLVSNDYGSTFLPGSPALYLKSNSSNPSLATMIPSTTFYTPSDSTQWRLETVDLSQFGTSQSLMVAFRGHSQYGNNCWIDNVKVMSATVPVLSTTAGSNQSFTSFTTGGNITDNGGKSVTKRGVCWSTTANPTIANDTTINGSGDGAFVANISGLTAGTTYYVRAYAINSIGTAYGNEVQVTTSAYVLPVVTTDTVVSITINSAVSGGNVTSTGGDVLTAKGVCWSTSQNPTISDSHTTDGTAAGAFVSNISGLAANTTYYVRAYATNSVGTAYGNERSFTTLNNATIPVLTTAAATSIDYTSAVTGGDVTSDGGEAVTARGICLSLSPNPTISNDTTINGSGLGVFSSNITGMTPGTTYYVRAYATNSIGTAYGNEINFTTTAASLPTVITTAASAVTTTTAVAGGDVTAENGASVTARGIAWSTTASPTVAGSHTTEGTGTGAFSSSLTTLVHSTLYYFRAYATNSVGTEYGTEMSFTTLVDGIEDASNQNLIKIYGSNDYVMIVSEKAISKGQIELLDINGKVVDHIVSDGTNTVYRFDSQNLAKGIYLVRFQVEGLNATQKISVQ